MKIFRLYKRYGALLQILRGTCTVFAALFLTAMLAAAPCFGGEARAADMIDTERESSLTVYFGKDGEGFSGVKFQLYRVADISETGRYALTGDFAGYFVSLEGLDSSGWRALAQTLDAYVDRDRLQPLAESVTGEDGKICWSGLRTGLYLVTGESYVKEPDTYTPEPFLVSLPMLDAGGTSWKYDVGAACKYGSDEDTPGDTVSRKVLKVWRDGQDKENRPQEIKVQLLMDGEEYDSVILNADNNWRYTWEKLEKDHAWKIVEEDVPPGYMVSVNRQGITFVVTNTRSGGDDGGGGGDDGGGGDKTRIPDPPAPTGDLPQPPVTEIPDDQIPLGNLPILPQTGMLWWPVPLLACSGPFLLLLGWNRRRNSE